mgnify:FL=1
MQIIGTEGARKLVAAFGGENFVVPNCREVYVRFRDQEIRRMRDEGMTTREIADIIEVGERTVRNLVRLTANDA